VIFSSRVSNRVSSLKYYFKDDAGVASDFYNAPDIVFDEFVRSRLERAHIHHRIKLART